MTRRMLRPRWRAAATAATIAAMLGTGAVAAFADESPSTPTVAIGTSTAATGTISGRVTRTDLALEVTKPLAGARVIAYRTEPEYQVDPSWAATATSTGGYSIGGLPAGDYYVVFDDPAAGSSLRREYWRDSPREDGATLVTVGAGAPVTGVDERLEPLLTERIAGADRYATSVAISKWGFDPGVPCVYIASGADFPDALSAGPAAARCGGPLLLVTPTGLPSNVAAELKRLTPERIVIAGGTGAVSASVASKLGAYAPTVERIAGRDRYETSRRIVADAFGSTAGQVWVATGRNFPDALAASGAAGAFGGIDRYATALQINRAFFNPETTPPAYALVTNGTKFPDALSGAALSGALGAPLHIVPPDCTPAGVAEHLEELRVSEAYLLGYFSKLSFGGEPFEIC